MSRESDPSHRLRFSGGGETERLIGLFAAMVAMSKDNALRIVLEKLVSARLVDEPNGLVAVFQDCSSL